jgi:hypothetical protein
MLDLETVAGYQFVEQLPSLIGRRGDGRHGRRLAWNTGTAWSNLDPADNRILRSW